MTIYGSLAIFAAIAFGLLLMIVIEDNNRWNG